MPSYSKTSRPSQANRDGARLWQGAHHFTMGNVHTVVADNYHYHSHGQDNRVFEATLLAAGHAHAPPRTANEQSFPLADRAKPEREFPLARRTRQRHAVIFTDALA
ncbi:hypothetical protein DFP72DRAFT_1076647 [Ephemerocybe angulata]|uniref:Uncharacterized protein n=1 Tax=Ephemerocybe angulata TaxID=980116 RepID=A0A8H6LW31_9AGAR|nr:hypothetical protein DFP72DRAFT_1076647 [Tulosesus angulatus]